jgi:hypothetical protein
MTIALQTASMALQQTVINTVVFVLPSQAYPVPGDANGDGVVTPADAQAAFDYYMGFTGPPVCENMADVCPNYPNGDGSVTPGDAQGIFNTYLELPNPCE